MPEGETHRAAANRSSAQSVTTTQSLGTRNGDTASPPQMLYRIHSDKAGKPSAADEEEDKVTVVTPPDRSAHPRAVVVPFVDALVGLTAMRGSWRALQRQ